MKEISFIGKESKRLDLIIFKIAFYNPIHSSRCLPKKQGQFYGAELIEGNANASTFSNLLTRNTVYDLLVFDFYEKQYQNHMPAGYTEPVDNDTTATAENRLIRRVLTAMIVCDNITEYQRVLIKNYRTPINYQLNESTTL
ncbi:hypothetical protein ACI65C_009681 [Semiaphis heraclei]